MYTMKLIDVLVLYKKKFTTSFIPDFILINIKC